MPSPKKVFVDLDEVKNKLDQFTIFDARFSLKDKNHLEKQFLLGHLPGAQMADMEKDLSAHGCGPARHPLPPASSFIAWCRARGVRQNKPVLCYDDDTGGMGGCRLWWMLQALGVEAYVLDGGIQGYAAAGLQLETGAPRAVPEGGSLVTESGFRHHVTLEKLPVNAVIVDARSPGRFHSNVRVLAGGDPAPGHIHGSANLFYASNIQVVNGVKRLRPCGELKLNVLNAVRNLLAADQLQKQDLSGCVFSCGSGVTACFNIAVATQAGLGTPMLYCGSWSEYGAIHRLAIEREVVDRHGIYLQMLSPCLCEGPRAKVSEHGIKVNGQEMKVLQGDVLRALNYLHVGEKAKVLLKGGRTFTVEVCPKPKL